jgi:hypothetical protein
MLCILVPTSAGVDSGGREGLPDDGLADVGGNEQGDAGAQTVALLQQLVQQQHDQACNVSRYRYSVIVSPLFTANSQIMPEPRP